MSARFSKNRSHVLTVTDNAAKTGGKREIFFDELERKLGATDTALALWSDLAACKNLFRAKALEELAKHHEHKSKDYGLALEMTRKALALENSAALRKREERLAKKVSRLT